MPAGLSLIWLALAVSVVLSALTRTRFFARMSRACVVCVASNVAVLALYYTPGLYGHMYYLAGVAKIPFLILALVYFAQRDPSPDWTYRAMCCVFILQTVTSGWHVLAALDSPHYEILSTSATIAELIILMVGARNARTTHIADRDRVSGSTARCSGWAKSHQKGRT